MDISRFQSGQAVLEGWAIFECNEGLELCRIDEQDDPDGDQLADDDEAWTLVTTRARNGSLYHKHALDLIAKLNPAERECIRKFTGY